MTHEALLQARRTIEVHSKSFSLAARFLPPRIRDDAVVLYAWCRRADDFVDRAEGNEARVRLMQLQRELDLVYGNERLDDPLLDEFQTLVRRRKIPREYPQELLAGLEMDVDNHTYADMHELLRYCYRVAGTVGLMMCHVMGVRDEEATRNAVHLGIAMQLTNICRDVLEDWERGRLYIPASVLQRFGVDELTPIAGMSPPAAARPAICQATRVLLEDAELFYRSGDAGLPSLAWRCSLSIRTARAVYSAIGDALGKMGYDPFRGRAYVPRHQKFRLVALSTLGWLAELPRRRWAAWRQPPRPASPPAETVVFPRDVLPLGVACDVAS